WPLCTSQSVRGPTTPESRARTWLSGEKTTSQGDFGARPAQTSEQRCLPVPTSQSWTVFILSSEVTNVRLSGEKPRRGVSSLVSGRDLRGSTNGGSSSPKPAGVPGGGARCHTQRATPVASTSRRNPTQARIRG